MSSRPRLLPRLTGAIALLACIPIVFGMCLAGASFVKNSRDPGERRALNAVEADKAPSPPEQAPPEELPLEGTPPDAAADDMSAVGTSLRYLPNGVTSLALRPWPLET